MRVLLSTDIEGITGITDKKSLDRNHPRIYIRAREKMTAEVNVVIKACFEAGATSVDVVDGHAVGRNLLRDKIDSRATVVKRKSQKMMMTGVQGCDVVLFIGYHGMAQKTNSFCAHTNSTKYIRSMHIDGHEVSEGHTNALIAKQFKKKVVYISGTDVGVQEVKERIPSISSTVNLESITMDRAISKEMPEHYNTIHTDVVLALENHETIDFIDGETDNVTITLRLNHPCLVSKYKDQMYESGKAIDITAKTISAAYSKYRSFLREHIRMLKKAS